MRSGGVQDVDRIVGIELAHTFRDRLRLKLFEDLLAHGVVNFGQRREVEVLAHQLNELRAELRIERLDQIAGIRLVQFANQRAQQARIAPCDRFADHLDVFGPDRAVGIAQQRVSAMRRRLGHVLGIDHADLAVSVAA
jgi:hypothetical protein